MADPEGRKECSRGNARRCKRATSPAKVCRCACGGEQHGTVRENGLLQYLRPRGLLDYLEPLKKAKKPRARRKKR